MSIISKDGKRRKPRRQSGAAVAYNSKDVVVQSTRLERSDSDRVIRRASMERKMSQRHSVRLPEDFLKSLSGLDDSFLNDSAQSMDNSTSTSRHGMDESSRRRRDEPHPPMHSEIIEAEILKKSKEALELSDSESEISADLDEDIDDVI